jgi:arsenate reductase
MLLDSALTKNMTEPQRYSVLVLCTGNSARSIMGEALFNLLGSSYFKAYSAGSRPVGRVNPYAIEQIRRLTIDDDRYYSKSWLEYAKAGAPSFDFIITVCSNAAEETCPAFLGEGIHINWSLPDPASVDSTGDATRAAFAQVFSELKQRIDTLLALPLDSMNKLQIANAMQHLAV